MQKLDQNKDFCFTADWIAPAGTVDMKIERVVKK